MTVKRQFAQKGALQFSQKEVKYNPILYLVLLFFAGDTILYRGSHYAQQKLVISFSRTAESTGQLMVKSFLFPFRD